MRTVAGHSGDGLANLGIAAQLVISKARQLEALGWPCGLPCLLFPQGGDQVHSPPQVRTVGTSAKLCARPLTRPVIVWACSSGRWYHYRLLCTEVEAASA